MLFLFFLGEEAQATQECECQAWAGPGGDHAAGRGQGGPAVQYGPAICQVKLGDIVNI